MKPFDPRALKWAKQIMPSFAFWEELSIRKTRNVLWAIDPPFPCKREGLSVRNQSGIWPSDVETAMCFGDVPLGIYEFFNA